MDKTISIARVRQAARDAYDAAKNLSGGANANYIPYLANIDSDFVGPEFRHTCWTHLHKYRRHFVQVLRIEICVESFYGDFWL